VPEFLAGDLRGHEIAAGDEVLVAGCPDDGLYLRRVATVTAGGDLFFKVGDDYIIACTAGV